MSPPSFPPGSAEADPGDAVPPAEKERNWWTPIAAAMDRWLEPRWRALLTWVALAALTGLTLDGHLHLLKTTQDFMWKYVDRSVPLGNWRVPLQVIGRLPPEMFLVTWFQPLLLRVDRRRAFVWITVAMFLGTAAFCAALFSQSHSMNRVSAALQLGSVLGLPGLVVRGCRTRPWMSLIGGALSVALIFLADPFSLDSPLWLEPVPMWIVVGVPIALYGAVMLYGTAPLPRKERAR